MDRASAQRLTRAGAEELARAMRKMRIPGHPRPYYLSFLIRDEESWRIQARFGGLAVDRHERRRNAMVDVRVGTRTYDQVTDGGLHDNDKESESFDYVELPFGGDLDAVRHGLWRLTDARYREAVEDLLNRRSHELTYLDPDRRRVSFDRRPKQLDLRWRHLPEVDRERWIRYVELASATLRHYPDVKASHVEFEADHVCRIAVNSEGSQRLECLPIWSIECQLWLLSKRGDGFPWTIKHTVTDPLELPSLPALRAEITSVILKLRRLSEAPTLRSFSGPALLDPIPAGLLVHEAIGHRLEASRLRAAGEGQTFKDSIGQQILPPFLSLRDNPRLERFEGRSLVGHYGFDDEGVDSRDASLVDHGRLVDFLTTRSGTRPRHRSSGHARSSYHERATSRMGVTILESHEGLTDPELKQALVAEIRRQRVPFGIRILEARNGETATETYDFQAFLGEVNLAARVYPDGREEWIRGVNFVGTPLNAIRSIVAAGSRAEVDNAFCGAESGYVPVSTICPALVVSELELQSKAESPFTQYSFPIPWGR